MGVQTVDNVWPSDDNSSCESDVHSFNETNLTSRKPKQKEWYETSLDGPAPATLTPRTQSIALTIAPEEKYVETPPMSKPTLEIPAESNPSPRVQETNMEIFNNNIPKNCTLVQAGQWKPYHEETKPFEMSDFYKYSTKYKNSPSKQDNEGMRNRSNSVGFRSILPQHFQQNSNGNYEDESPNGMCKTTYQALQPLKCQPFNQTK